ncbi:SDR family NAD(P)-dependent oxidoreductase [Sulfitobacter sp. JBTF-M27]|uniref:SDR family NAD(P)-dependent oxidoreductase n=1 Tax=Sulfitobacter sediminilitoris TaxID=2698830 RepID=A0A6P0CDJ9_9RHOB|nr:SDR family oxidoreductase [Sulfitobacter sediminilitoris]NEK23957.1 SDR family NAD(P)-dependent oxidoreductase [Sulfitobacter sediminilitoris]
MKSILITGASAGIGRATAELFLAEGWRVGLVARSAEALEEMAAAHAHAVALPADVTDASALEAAFDTFGDLDVLFNNAGMFGPSAPIDEIAIADWEQVMMVNLHGMFLAARLAFARMRAQGRGGRIINNGSISAHTPRPGSVCYTTTKHAITGLTKSLSLDGRDLDIACGQIDIGNAETDMVANLKKMNPDTQTMRVENAAKSVLHMADMPRGANVLFMTVMANKMPFVGRG